MPDRNPPLSLPPTAAACEHIGRPHGPFCAGVQWHPELLPGRTSQRRLFAALVHAAIHRRHPSADLHP